MKNLIEYKKFCGIAKKTFNRKKREHFKKFASTIDSTDMKYMWNKCRILKNKWTKTNEGRSKRKNLQWINKIEEVMDKISPPFPPSNPSWLPMRKKNQVLLKYFSYTEFNIPLESWNSKSFPAPDWTTIYWNNY